MSEIFDISPSPVRMLNAMLFVTERKIGDGLEVHLYVYFPIHPVDMIFVNYLMISSFVAGSLGL